MIASSFDFEKSSLHFQKTGAGKKVLLAFHGFGQDNQAFNRLAQALSNDYTIYAFDLFFHGKSQWNQAGDTLEKDFWKNLLTKFLQDESIEFFSLLGFSMGGKFALATLEVFPSHVKEIFLLAPDGIKTSMWYSLATYPVALRNIFKSMIRKPQRFQVVGHAAFRIGLIDKGILRFVELQMNTEEKRSRVYNSWVIFRHLTFNMKIIANLINQNKIRLVMIVGKFDKIITAKNMHRLLRYVNRYQLNIPETGHNGIIDASIPFLQKDANV